MKHLQALAIALFIGTSIPQTRAQQTQNNIDTLQYTSTLQIKASKLQLAQQYNTTPYGWNDGPMIPAKGYQAMFTAGIKLNYKHWDLKLQPELVYAANNQAEDFPTTETDQVRLARLGYLNNTDIPFQFGNKAYTKTYGGQSHLYYQFKKMAIGISTENRWWGPGYRNALILSNNAPGFLHATWHSTKPLQTKIGQFEYQLIAGRLKGSGYTASPEQYLIGGQNYEVAKPNDWRYLNGLTISYQPKWIPGLKLGLNRVFQVYHQEMGNGITDYLPVLTPLQKNLAGNEDDKKRDQLASLYLQWHFAQEKATLYFEYGWNDHASSIVDFLLSPEHSRAFIVGFNKTFPTQQKDKYLQFKFESTILQQTADRIVRPTGAWYLHGSVRHGYTHRGQVLGAGIGPGSNLQTIEINTSQAHKITGFRFERYAHNLDFFYDAYPDPNMADKKYSRKWVDLILNAYTSRQYGPIALQTSLSAIWTRNYQWQKNNSKLNAQIQTSISYQF